MLSKASVQSTTLALLLLLACRDARADTGADSKRRAGELFEQGVRQFSSAQYEAAAQAFLAADELLPSSRALINGITAARRAGLHLLVARAAQRALERQDIEPGGTALAREALAEAARSLTHVDITCTPEPCTITLDGARASSGAEYILPGTHDFVGVASSGARATEHLSGAAGASYRITLAPKEPAPTKEPAPPVPTPPPEQSTRAEPKTNQQSIQPASHRKPLPPAVFIAGGVGTVALAALWTWSGIDTLDFKRTATADSWSHVESRALRTDLLMVGTLVLGGATAAAGIWLVDWGPSARATVGVLPSGGIAVAAEGRF